MSNGESVSTEPAKPPAVGVKCPDSVDDSADDASDSASPDEVPVMRVSGYSSSNLSMMPLSVSSKNDNRPKHRQHIVNTQQAFDQLTIINLIATGEFLYKSGL